MKLIRIDFPPLGRMLSLVVFGRLHGRRRGAAHILSSLEISSEISTGSDWLAKTARKIQSDRPILSSLFAKTSTYLYNTSWETRRCPGDTQGGICRGKGDFPVTGLIPIQQHILFLSSQATAKLSPLTVSISLVSPTNTTLVTLTAG